MCFLGSVLGPLLTLLIFLAAGTDNGICSDVVDEVDVDMFSWAVVEVDVDMFS